MIKNFTPEGVHCFPTGMYDGPFRGAAKIAERWQAAVANLGSYWTIDSLVIDERLELGGFDYAARGYPLVSPRPVE